MGFKEIVVLMDKRYWDRVGMYVTEEFANQWIEKMNVSEGEGGRHLDDDIEEYIITRPPTPDELRQELKQLFEQPFEEVELPLESQAIIFADEMERNRVPMLKELKSEGHTIEEAKEIFQERIDEGVANILGVEVGSLSVGLGVASEDDSGADAENVE